MSDPTAAERARRYRARQRAELVTAEPVVDLLRAIAADIHAMRAAVDKLPERDVTATERDVTQRHARTRDARVYAPAESDALTQPTAASKGVRRDAAVTPQSSLAAAAGQTRILEALRGVHAPQTVAAIADACELGQMAAVAALVELRSLGLVERIAAETAAERDRWQLLVAPVQAFEQIELDERVQA